MARAQNAGASTELTPIVNSLGRGVALKFNKQKITSLEWDAEKRYALAILQGNDFTRSYALKNPESLVNSMLDVARLGLTLSPALGYCYLVPRKVNGLEIVHAVPSYKGLEQIALKSGKVTLIQTELVYANDHFERGVGKDGAYIDWRPARGDRGELEYAFCMAWYDNGRMHAEVMTREDLDACEAAALAASNGKAPSWKGAFKSEMQKKCVVRRASKHWPTDRHLELAMKILDRAEPMDFGPPGNPDDDEQELCAAERDFEVVMAALVDVPQNERAKWITGGVNAMGYPVIDAFPLSKLPELQERLVNRMKVFAERRAEAAAKAAAESQPEQEVTDGQG